RDQTMLRLPAIPRIPVLATAMLLCVAVTTAGQTAPAIEHGHSSALRSRLGPAPHEATGFKNLDPNFRRASNLLRTRLAVLSLFSLIGSPRHFEALPAATVDTAVLWSHSGQTTATWIGHSTVLVQLACLHILTDPDWGPP